jgi:hypothetical protein
MECAVYNGERQPYNLETVYNNGEKYKRRTVYALWYNNAIKV